MTFCEPSILQGQQVKRDKPLFSKRNLLLAGLALTSVTFFSLGVNYGRNHNNNSFEQITKKENVLIQPPTQNPTQQELTIIPKVKSKSISLEPTLIDSTKHYLQVGAFSKEEDAKKLYDKFDSKYGFEVIKEKRLVNGKNLDAILVNYYEDKYLKSFIEGQAGIEKGIIMQRKGKIKHYTQEQKIAIMKKDCEEVGIELELMQAVWKHESANGKKKFGFDLEARFAKNENGEYILEELADGTKRRIFEGYNYATDSNGKTKKLTASGPFHINTQAHKIRVEDAMDFAYSSKFTAKLLRNYFIKSGNRIRTTAHYYVAGPNGNHKRKEVRDYGDRINNTYVQLKQKSLKKELGEALAKN